MILERLFSPEFDFTDDQLREMLQAELAKPMEQMDRLLVIEIMKCFFLDEQQEIDDNADQLILKLKELYDANNS